jgi:hypothetical protein
MWKNIKQFCIAAHRYLGFLLCLLFVIWFLSGFVMMYVDFPVWGKDKQLQYSSPIDSESVQIPVSEAAEIAGFSGTSGTVKLEMMLNRPVYRFEGAAERAHIFADTGESLGKVSKETAAEIAHEAYGDVTGFTESGLMQRQDQWIPQQGNVRYLPYYRFKLADPDNTWIYVSETGGELFLKVTGRERFLAWLGPIPHWIYFRDLRVNARAWSEVIIWTSAAGVLMCLFGIITGLLRIRKPRNRNSINGKIAFSPFKDRWFRWHHYFGFVFGLVIFTWTLSGLFSMNPWGLSPPRVLSADEQRTWQQGEAVFDDYSHDMQNVIIAGSTVLHDIRRVELHRFEGEPFYRLFDGEGNFISAGYREGRFITKTEWDERDLLEALDQITAEKPLRDIETLYEYDNYYYSRDGARALPVIRVRYQDPASTWYYIDPARAEVVMKNETASRAYRWLYNGLHSLDFAFLVNRRPLWDIVVIFLMIGGTISSITGLVLTWNWIQKKDSM